MAPLKILVVDDEKDICDLLSRILSRPPEFLVDCAQSAEIAERKLDTESYALVLSDYKLEEGKTGLDVLYHAKLRHPNIITILMTGYGSDNIATRAVAEGVYDYLLKPFRSILEVKNAVDRGLRYYALLTKYNEKLADASLQKELLEETLEKARRTREILRALVQKIHKVDESTPPEA